MITSLIRRDWIIWESVNKRGVRKSSKKHINDIYHSELFKLFLALIICGLLLVASSSSYVALNNFDNMFYYLQRQALFVLFAISVGFIIIRIPVIFWERIGPGLLLLSVISLLAVFILNRGEVNGSYRWIQIGPINFQPSEFAKLSIIIYLSGYLIRHKNTIRNNIFAFIRPMFLVAIVGVLVFVEPDLGGALVILMLAMALMFIGGVNIFQFTMFIFVEIAIVVILALSASYRWARITALNDNIMQSVNTYDSNYQILQSLVAFGQGKYTGLGFGASLQKMLYLPEAHTDFIFAILAEELGLVGIILLGLLFALLVKLILKIANQAIYCKQTFSAFYAYGYGISIAIHVFIHIAVTMRLLPTTGMTLPFISYGGSSLLAFTIGAAILLRVEYELCPKPKPIDSKPINRRMK